MTPVLLQQFRSFRLRFRCPPASALNATDRPIGVTRRRASIKLLWASVSDEVAERLAAGTTKLRPRASGRLDEGESEAQNEKSTDNLWVVEGLPWTRSQSDRNRSGVIAPGACPGPAHDREQHRSGGGAEEMVKDLKEKVFPDREISFLVVKDGKRNVRTI